MIRRHGRWLSCQQLWKISKKLFYFCNSREDSRRLLLESRSLCGSAGYNG